MAFHSGILGPCWWSAVIGTFTEEDVHGFLAHLRYAAAHAAKGSLILDITHDVPMPTPVQRKKITDIISHAPNLDLVAGHALVVSSPVARGALTAINWVVRPKFDEKIFGNPPAAVAWLAARNPKLDEAALLADLARGIPELATLKW
jgi:hypothetical protein